MSPRQRIVKTTLWLIVGVLAVVTLARFKAGLGATTGLSDAAPWGFWIAFDVMAGVALAAGGFVLAATVYIFHLERYRPFVRPAVLTAFLGYAAVATGLFYDLGLPWHIWHPIVYPQTHSVLFEVALCVMLYLTVLLLEFAPVVLEHPAFNRPLFVSIHRMLRKATIVLVIAGIMLSTLHQSSLGSLFLIAPYRLHPLWYSPMIWVLFFVSAVGLGLMMVTLESFFSAWLFGHRPRMDLLPRLGKAASVVLLLYAALRLGDLGVRGQLGRAFDGSSMSSLFLFELSLGAVVPGILLLLPSVRNSSRGLGIAALMAVFGIIGYRFDVCIVAFERPEGVSYFPSWTEVAVSVGIVAAALLVFIFFVEHLKVCSDHGPGAAQSETPLQPSRFNPGTLWPLTPDSLAAPRRHSLAVVIGVAGAVAFLPDDVLFGARPLAAPVARPRVVEGLMTQRAGAPGHVLRLGSSQASAANSTDRTRLMLIDGNRDGRMVPFPHEAHVAELGGDDACGQCHHQNRPFQLNSACHECHRDMFSPTDIFDHDVHVAKLGGNDGCVRCHRDTQQAKTRETATPCGDCHSNMYVKSSRIKPPAQGSTGVASSYVDAMHGLCVECHEEKTQASPSTYPEAFAECLNCHRDVGDAPLKTQAPYVTQRSSASDRRVAAGRI